MPGSGSGTFADPDDYQASLRQARIDFLVTSRGSFNAHLTWTTLHRMQLLHGEEDLPRIAYITLEPTLMFVGFATRPDPPILWAGAELQTGQIIFHSRGERFHQRTTGPCGWGLIGMAPQHLERSCLDLSGKALAAPLGARSCTPPRATWHGCGACMRRPAASPRPGPNAVPPRGCASHRRRSHSRARCLSRRQSAG